MEQKCQGTILDEYCGTQARVKSVATHPNSEIASKSVYHCMPCALILFKSGYVIFEGARVTINKISYDIEIVAPEEKHNPRTLEL